MRREKREGWTPPYFGVSHLQEGERTHTLSDRGTFVEYYRYCWHAHQVLNRATFFVRPLPEGRELDKNEFWNCGAYALTWAKHYVTGCHVMTQYAGDMSKYTYHLEEKE